MHNIIISDTSCLIVLSKINELGILKILYNEISITKEISEEFALELPNWIKIKEVKDKKFQHLLETQLDKGESSAIALAMETENPLIIIDENKARQFAKKLDLRITGTLGILIYAKNKGVIKDIEPIITKLLATDFRISKKLVDLMLELNIDLM